MENGVFWRAVFFENSALLLMATARDQGRLELDNIIKRVGGAIDAAMGLAWEQPQALALLECVAAFADNIGHRTAGHHIDLKFRMLVGLQPRNTPRGIREKKEAAIFPAKLEVFDLVHLKK